MSDLVSFETSKLLKEKGFHAPCKAWYAEYTSMYGGEKYEVIQFDDRNRFEPQYKFICSVPTFYQVMTWLIEKHNLFISTIHLDRGWFSYIGGAKIDDGKLFIDCESRIDNYDIPICETYEEAMETSIKYCLEKLI